MKSVVLCASSRFKPQVVEFANELRKLGVVVFEPPLAGSAKEWKMDEISDDFKRYASLGLTYNHFQKIRIADVVFVYNEGGYIGNSCTLELGFAVACAKPIYALEPDNEEVCRDILIKEYIKTPQELVEKLR